MKKVVIVILVTFALISCSEVSLGSGKKAKIENMTDSLSYCVGLSIGNSIKNYQTQVGVDINMEVFDKALDDVMNDADFDIPKEQVGAIMQMVEQKMMMQASAKNIQEGQEFLAANKEKEGVITTESGLQYEVLKEGNGPKPTEDDVVSVHYVGTMIDGTQFDSSYDRGEPAQFPVTRVIKGWTEALLMMPVGSKWKLYIPSELGYGARPPQRSNIKPNSVLIFEVELLGIIPQDKAND